ncbi:MAG: DUF4012 domain-containing protein [Actinobacteria bacterium]|nr:DUF4012 domain-containing protein [Actinomycetota bacterium]
MLLALVALILFGAAMTAVTLAGAAGPLREGRAALARGRVDLLRGDAGGASSAFEQAGRAFARARSATSGTAGRLSTLFPILGRNSDVADRLALAGIDVARSGDTLSAALTGLPDGISALAPHHGAIPLDTLEGMTSDVDRASGLADLALGELQGSPGALLLPPVSDARARALDAIGSSSGTLSSASAILDVLPGLAGGDGPRRYFFGAANPAELRGSGGLIGAYSVLTVDHGRLSFSRFGATEALGDAPADAVPAPSPDFRADYDQFGGAGSWQNINMTPDFPSAARAIEGLYRLRTGQALDGVIVADPAALQALLDVTGAVRVPGLGARVDARNVIAFTEERAYGLFHSPRQRKQVLGSVAAGVFSRFVAMEGKGLPRIRAVADAASGGHLLIYADDPIAESALQRAGVSGALSAPPGDALSVVVNSASGSKVDYWAERSVSYRVELGPGGSAASSVDVTIHNGAPTTGAPRYVLGPVPGLGLKAGDSRSLVTVYCAPGSRPYGPRRDGEPIEVRVGSELGLPWVQDFPTIPAGESTAFHLGEALGSGWEGDERGGTYRLTFLGQTTTRPTTFHLEVVAPPGMAITSTSVPMRVSGSTATWEGHAAYRMSFEVSFAPPLPVRLWRTLTGWIA